MFLKRQQAMDMVGISHNRDSVTISHGLARDESNFIRADDLI